MRVAAPFQEVIVPSGFVVMMASSEDSTTDESLSEDTAIDGGVSNDSFMTWPGSCSRARQAHSRRGKREDPPGAPARSSAPADHLTTDTSAAARQTLMKGQ